MTLRELRLKNNFSQKEISKKLNIKQNTYSQYENGIRQPNIQLLPNLASCLNCSIEETVIAIINSN